jgi:hypothetical protein
MVNAKYHQTPAPYWHEVLPRLLRIFFIFIPLLIFTAKFWPLAVCPIAVQF